MSSFYIHPSTYVDQDVKIGWGTKIWFFCHLSEGAQIGDCCLLGQNVMLDKGVVIKSFCKVQNNVSLYSQVLLEEGVFCGPSCVFTNVHNPRAFIDRKKEIKPTKVGIGSTIGANATIVCGLEIGAFSFIGAGAVVTRNVPQHALIVGNPAKQIGWMSHAGEKLNRDLICPIEKKQYELKSGNLVLKNRTESDLEYVSNVFKKNNPFLSEDFIGDLL